MPVETWFPTVIFYEDLDVDVQIRENAVEAVRERAEALMDAGAPAVTASDATNDLHLDPRITALFGLFGPPLKEFLFENLGIDPQRTDFYVGRCWPVVQSESGISGGAHVHHGGAFSGVFYLEVPDGSGALQFSKPLRTAYDNFDKTELNGLNFLQAEYAAVENRLLVFSSELEHWRLPNSGDTAGPRTAIAFDIYSMVDLEVKGGGMPRYELLRRVV